MGLCIIIIGFILALIGVEYENDLIRNLGVILIAVGLIMQASWIEARLA